MMSDKNILFGQIFLFILLLLYFFKSGDPLTLFISTVALLAVLIFASKIKNYDEKYVDYILPPFFLVQGLILVYTYLFRQAYLTNPFNLVLFYFFVAIFIVMIYIYAHYYRHMQSKT